MLAHRRASLAGYTLQWGPLAAGHPSPRAMARGAVRSDVPRELTDQGTLDLIDGFADGRLLASLNPRMPSADWSIPQDDADTVMSTTCSAVAAI